MKTLSLEESKTINGGTAVPIEYIAALIDAARGMQVSWDLGNYEAYFQYKSLYGSIMDGILALP